MKWNRKRLPAKRPTPRPSLRFSPYAWAKLLYLRDRGETEIGGFGLSDADDPLLIIDVLTVKQRCTPITVAFDDAAVADLFDEMVDQGVSPDRFAKIWLHSHPGECPLPSSTDEETFTRVFGRMDWAVMGIVARGGARYARLAYHTGPGGAFNIPVRVDYGAPFDGSEREVWEQEYVERVVAAPLFSPPKSTDALGAAAAGELFDIWNWEEIDGGAPRPGSV